MTRSWTSLLVLALVAAAVALTACGDDDDGGDGADEQEITDAITRAATGTDPALCTEVQTQNFTEQTTGEKGEEAVTSCEEDAGQAVADEVEVSGVEIDGDTANAEAAITGSFFDGQTIEIGLVQEADRWKLDELIGFIGIDREAAANAIRTELSEGEQAAPPQAVDCVTGNIEGLSDEEFERLFLFNDRELEARVFDACFEGQQ